MKKAAAAVFLMTAMISVSAKAAHTQNDLYTAAQAAIQWQESNAQPRVSPGSLASDYYIMALARLNMEYDFQSYAKLTSTLSPDNDQAWQLRIMTNTVCGSKMTDSVVWAHTNNADLSFTSTLADAIITIDSGGYKPNEQSGQGPDSQRLVQLLLPKRQEDGSFDKNVLTTAKAVTALSPYTGITYQSEDNQYSYSTDDIISAAIDYLSGEQYSSGGYASVQETAYVIMALDSVGIDADNDPRFINSGNSPVSYLLSLQSEDGSFNSNANDNAYALCALASHLRAMQGLSRFFNFSASDAVAKPPAPTASESVPEPENHAGEPPKGNTIIISTDPDEQNQQGNHIIKMTPLPTTEPKHSAIEGEQYGPMPFVGPMPQDTDKDGTTPVHRTNTESSEKSGSAAPVIIIICVAAAAAVLVILKKRGILPRTKLDDAAHGAEQSQDEENLIEKMDTVEEIVPTDELYDPDFIKKLIPVDEIDTSIDSLISETDDAGSDSENT